MPQEHYVLKCYSCETFQVAHIVKKSKKWECKICAAKQSLKRNYGKGSGKDCRIQVMRLNELRLSKDNSLNQREGDLFDDFDTGNSDHLQIKEKSKNGTPLISKWAEYMEENETDKQCEDDDSSTDFIIKTDEKTKKRVKKMNKTFYSKKRKICEEVNEQELMSGNCEKARVSLSTKFESCNKKEQINFPINAKNKLISNKYAKYLEEQEDKNDSEIKRSPDIFDSDPVDLDSILNFS